MSSLRRRPHAHDSADAFGLLKQRSLMKNKILILGLLVTLALALLAAGLVWRPEERPVPDPVVGSVDGSGNLVLHVFSPGAKIPDVACLMTDYGVVLYQSREHGAIFVLGDRAKKSVREFGSYAEFVEALGELPPKSVVTIYDRCTVPRFYDFYPVHEELFFKFERDCTAKGVRIANMPKITCTCAEER